MKEKEIDRPVIEFSLRHFGKVRTSLYELEQGLFLVVRRPQAGALAGKTSVDLEVTSEWSEAGILSPHLRVVPIPYAEADTMRLLTRLKEGETACFRWCSFEVNSKGNVVVYVDADVRVILPRQTFDQVLDAVRSLSAKDTSAPDKKGQVQ